MTAAWLRPLPQCSIPEMTAWSHETRERTFQYVSILICLATAILSAVLVPLCMVLVPCCPLAVWILAVVMIPHASLHGVTLKPRPRGFAASIN